MPKMNEKSKLARAIRAGKLMLSVIPDAYDTGDVNRMIAALQLAADFDSDVRAVLQPLIDAQAIASNGHSEQAAALVTD